MDIYEVLKKIDNQNKSFNEGVENTTDANLYYNNSIVNYDEIEVNGCFGGMY